MKAVVSTENMRLSDKHTIETKTHSRELMYRAGEGIFKSHSWEGRTLVVCGSGNNAGDGYVVASLLSDGGYDVEILLLKEQFSQDGLYYFNICKEKKIKWSVYDGQMLTGYSTVLDCILGTGFKGEVAGNVAEIIDRINHSGAYVISADINSGLNGDSGMGRVSVKSDLTVSIGTPKAGHYLNMAKDKIGRLVNVDIGIDIVEPPYFLLEKKDVAEYIGTRSNFSHKGTYGYITLIGGSVEYSGAVKLAGISASAMRTGVGVVRIATPSSLCPGVLPYVLESTLYPLSERDGAIAFCQKEIEGALAGASAVAIGMGLGQRGDNARVIEYVLSNYQMPVIIDADGLNTLAKMDKEIIKKSKCSVILTPHLKELERLSGVPMAQIQESPVFYAKEYAARSGAVVLLKGTSTVITDGTRVLISDTGCPGMATAGSGDVLSGIICALCASHGDALMSAAAGAYINGYAGEIAEGKYGSVSMIASDTARSVAEAILSITAEKR